ncbi:MAG: acyl carrier protein [Phycisphaerae bacterium]|nr:acyl carrier protein [Phycisphaerae bacterium]
MNMHTTTSEETGRIIADVLAIEPHEVHPSSRFVEDLGGESIDFLELSFQLERHYGVRMNLQAMAGSNNLPTDAQGRVTPEGLEQMKRDYPFLDHQAFAADPQMSRFMELITVEAITRFVQQSVSHEVAGPAPRHIDDEAVAEGGQQGTLGELPG